MELLARIVAMLSKMMNLERKEGEAPKSRLD
jgi:hypothetical protein